MRVMCMQVQGSKGKKNHDACLCMCTGKKIRMDGCECMECRKAGKRGHRLDVSARKPMSAVCVCVFMLGGMGAVCVSGFMLGGPGMRAYACVWVTGRPGRRMQTARAARPK